MSKLLNEIRNDAAGLAVLNDWLGEGGEPVHISLAFTRARICISPSGRGVPCPLNVSPLWWERVKDAIANTIRKHLAVKHQLGISTPFDDRLNMCRGCGCAIALKIWCPISHIKAHTNQPEGFPSWCWIRTEIEQSPKSP